MNFNDILFFIIPAWGINICLNLLYPISKKYSSIKKINTPIDGGKFWGTSRILGNSTTYLGLGVAVLAGGILQFIVPTTKGVLISLCMYTGHALGSFIKRRLGYKDGEFALGIDHGDGIVFTGLVLLLIRHISIQTFIIGIILTYIVYPILCFIGYILKLRKHPF